MTHNDAVTHYMAAMLLGGPRLKTSCSKLFGSGRRWRRPCKQEQRRIGLTTTPDLGINIGGSRP